MKALLSAGLVVSALAAGSTDAATVLNLTGLGGTGVTGRVEFDYQSFGDAAARLTIDIENTTPAGLGGFITAFGFNVPSVTGVTFTSIAGDIDDAGNQMVTELGAPNESNWFARFDFDEIKTPNAAGDFDFGVKNKDTVNSFITGGVGTPSASRITVAENTRFTLDIIGSGLDDFSDSTFETAFLSTGSTNGNAGSFNFGLRFQGIGPRDLSDFAVVPLPSTGLLLLFGIACGTYIKGFRKNAT